MMERREVRALAADMAAQERATGSAPSVGKTADTYIRAVHPGTGQHVTFVPGEALPTWATDALRAGRGTYDAEQGVWTIAPASTGQAPVKRAR